jgi:hypothetical protein
MIATISDPEYVNVSAQITAADGRLAYLLKQGLRLSPGRNIVLPKTRSHSCHDSLRPLL